jgi:hypothetical protein
LAEGSRISDILDRPLSTPAAWVGGELSPDGDWVLSPDASLIAELSAACGAVEGEGRRWHETDQTDFPLPSWKSLIHDLRCELEGGRGFALIRSVPVADRTAEGARLLLWALGRHLGFPEPQDAAGNLLHDVRDTGKDLEADDVRAYQTRLPINYHNDGADAFMLLCYRSARSGGRSKLVSAVSVFNRILRDRPELAEALQQSFDFDARGQQRPGAPPYQRLPIYSYHAGYLNVLYKREYIDLAQRFDDVPPLTSLQVEALDLMDRTCDEMALEFVMEPGDIVVANNYDVLHARSAFADDSPEAAGRHMLRLWLSLPNGRPLPPAFEATREFHHSYRRRLAAAGPGS